MVRTLDPEQVKRDAISFFRQSELTPRWAWIETLSPVHLRLFAVDLADALKEATITGDAAPLIDLLDDWEATAELDASRAVIEHIRAPKHRFPLSRFAS